MDGTDALAGTTDQASPAASPQPAAAAAPSQTATPAAPIATQDAAPSTAQIQQQDAPAYTPPAEQPAAAPQALPQRPGLAGILDAVADMLSPRPTTVSRDDNGNNVVTQQPQSRGAQWANIGLTALRGAATAAAAPPGPGHVGRGVSAALEQGIQTQQDQANQAQTNADKTFQQRQQAKLNNINYQLLSRKLVANEFELQQSQVKAGQDAVTFSNNLMDRERTLGSYDLGTYKDASEIPSVMAKQPQFMQRLYKEQGIIAIPQFAPDGTRTGVQLFERKQDVNSQPAPDGTIAHKWTLGDKPSDPPHMTTFVPVGATNGDIFRYDAKAMVDAQTYAKEQADLTQKAAQAAEEKANASKAPSEIAKNNAEAAKAAADAKKANHDTDEASDPQLVDQIGTGHITADRMSYLLARNPQLLDAVTKKYPDFDGSKAASYPKAYADFTSSKANTAGGALNAGATAIEHLKKLQDLNTVKSHIPGTSDYNAYHNQLDTLAPELAKFYGDTTVPAIAALKSTLGATLPGNRQAAITTQAQSMGKKFDNYEQTWKNAAPSSSYEAPMPNVSDAAKEARAALDPEYRQRVVQASQLAARTPAAQNPQQTPQTPRTPQQTPQQVQQIQQKAAAAGVPNNAHAAVDQAGNVVGYQDATGYHALGAK